MELFLLGKIYSYGNNSSATMDSEHANVCKPFNVSQTRAFSHERTIYVSVETQHWVIKKFLPQSNVLFGFLNNLQSYMCPRDSPWATLLGASNVMF